MESTRRSLLPLMFVFFLACIVCSGSATVIVGMALGRMVLMTFAAVGILVTCVATVARLMLGRAPGSESAGSRNKNTNGSINGE